MRFRRRHSWLYLCICLICIFMLSCLIYLFIHYIWCGSGHLCHDRMFCPPRQITINRNISKLFEKPQSLCSSRSTKRGQHQQVIGVSAYLSKIDNKKLLPKLRTFLYEYIQEAKEKYPKWIIRIYYYSLDMTKEEIDQIESTYENVDFCDSTNIPGFGNILDWLPGKMQRFLPIADPLVDIYMSRDIDSPILEREITVVNQWLDSKHTIHIIRDHPEHVIPILGGLWGIKVGKERSWMKDVSQYLLSPDIVRCYAGEGDQTFLQDYIWPHANKYQRRTLEFDSFCCEQYPNSRPFPTRKESPTLFVGCRRPNCTRDEHPECPIECRPPDHQDWIWC